MGRTSIGQEIRPVGTRATEGRLDAAGIGSALRSAAPDEIALLTRLGRALHRSGAPAHRLEDALDRVARRLGVPGQFFSTPTAFFATFDGSGTTVLARTEPGEVDLGRLADLDELLDDFAAGRRSVRAAANDVDELLARPARWSAPLTVFCYAIASAAAARFFGGGWRELVAAALGGLVIGLVGRFATRAPVHSRLFEPASAFLVSLLVVALASVLKPLAVPTATLGGLIVLVPGLTLTLAMTELSTRHLVSGTARLTGAFTVFLTIAFGVALGGRIGALAFTEPAAVIRPLPLPDWTLGAALLVAPLAFVVLFRARAKDLPWIVLSGVTVFAGARAGAHLLGPELGTFVGAVVAGVFGNVYANSRRGPASVPIVPGVMMLVPGSFGFRSLSSLLARDVLSGLETAFLTVLVAVALGTGLLVANVLVPPRRAL